MGFNIFSRLIDLFEPGDAQKGRLFKIGSAVGGPKLRGIKPGIITARKPPHLADWALHCPLVVSGGPSADGCSDLLADMLEQLEPQQRAEGKPDIKVDLQDSSHII